MSRQKQYDIGDRTGFRMGPHRPSQPGPSSQGVLPFSGGGTVLKLYLRSPKPTGGDGVQVKMNQPFELLEAHIVAPQNTLHFADGFFIFPTWRDGKIADYAERIQVLHRQLRLQLNKKHHDLDLTFHDSPDGSSRLLSFNFETDVGDAIRRLNCARNRIRAQDVAAAEHLLGDTLQYFPSLPEAAVLAVLCCRSRGSPLSTASQQMLVRAAMVLEGAIQTHELGLKSLADRMPANSPGIALLKWSREYDLNWLQDAYRLAAKYLKDSSSYLDQQRELHETKGLFDTLASSTRTRDQHAQALSVLIASPLGQSVRFKLAVELRTSPLSLQVALLKLAPKVASRPFHSMERLEHYVVSSLYRRLTDAEASERAGLSPTQRKAVAALHAAREALYQELNGREPTVDELCSYLHWDKERFLEMMQEPGTAVLDDRTGDDYSFGQWKSEDRDADD